MKPDAIEIGTSGWKFDDWAGTFYPLRVPKSRWLEYYAARFSVGELNSSYYRIPSARSMEAIAKRTPKEFKLFVKVHADVTHQRTNPERSLKELAESACPVRETGKLLGFLAQFPASFKQSADHVDYVMRLTEMTGDVRLCVEFRDQSWEDAGVLEECRGRGVTWVTPDEPHLPNLMDPKLRATSDILYLRLHGRNDRNWYHAEHGDRYDYNYTEQEILQWAWQLLKFESTDVKRAYLFFNNCHVGQAANNAWWLKQWIEAKRSAAERSRTDDFNLSSS